MTENRFVSLAALPIIDEQETFWGNEFLYRNDPDAYVAFIEDEDQATLDVLSLAALCRMHASREEHMLFNFTPWAILEDFCLCLSSQKAVLGLTDISDNAATLRAIDAAKDLGYSVSVTTDSITHFTPDIASRVDILEIDVSTVAAAKARKLVAIARRHNVQVLGKHISTQRLYKTARGVGCTLFQGHFLHDAKRISHPRYSSSASLRMRLLEEIDQSEPDLNALAVLVEADPSMSYRVLTLFHLGGFSQQKGVTSIKDVIKIAGWRRLRSWLRLMVVTDISPPRNAIELAHQAVIRAKTLELTALESGQQELASPLFFLGLFSLLDAQLDTSMDHLVDTLPVERRLADALRGLDNGLFPWLGLVVMDEQGDYERADQVAAELGLPGNLVSSCRLKSVAWAHAFFNLSR